MLKAILLFFAGYFVFNFVVFVIFRKKSRDLEIQFIEGAIHFEQLKHHMMQMLDLVYEKASEEDPKYAEEHKKVKEKLEEKFNAFGDEWVKNLTKTLGYSLSYSSWSELIKRVETTANLLKKQHESRKRD